MIPGFLPCTSGNTHPESVFTDLRLDAVFSAAAVSVMRHPCDKESIRDRQRLFRCLENAAFYNSLLDFRSALAELEKYNSLFTSPCNVSERLHIHVRLLKSYLFALEKLRPLSGYCSITDNVAGYWGDAEHTESAALIYEDMKTADALLAEISVFDVSFSGKTWLLPDAGSVSYAELVASAASKAGLSVSSSSSVFLKPDKAMDTTITALFPGETKRLSELLYKYEELDFTPLIAYIAQIDFYLEVVRFIKKANDAGIVSCYPKISDIKEFRASDIRDATLLAKEARVIVPNDASFTREEPFFFLTGANGGGKTTYLRAVGMNLIMFLSGCPVFAESASIYPFSRVVAHFPRDERFDNTGRLDEELKRVREILDTSDGNAFLLFNETFSGTDDARGSSMTLDTSAEIKKRGISGLFVTHFHEVSGIGYPMLHALVSDDGENRRIYKIARDDSRTASYAADILKKYGLDSVSLAERRKNGANKHT